MVTKLKLRIVDGIPEVDGEPADIAEVLRQLSITPQPAQPTRSIQPAIQHEERDILSIQDHKELDSDKLIEIIESGGEPITFSMGDLQKKIYGKRISSRDDKKLYQTFRTAFDNAKKQLEKKYPDHHWDWTMITIEDSPTKRFKLVRNHPLPIQQQIKAPDETPKPQPHEEEVDLFKM
jgi:signal recognition particle subunit SEC65